SLALALNDEGRGNEPRPWRQGGRARRLPAARQLRTRGRHQRLDRGLQERKLRDAPALRAVFGDGALEQREAVRSDRAELAAWQIFDHLVELVQRLVGDDLAQREVRNVRPYFRRDTELGELEVDSTRQLAQRRRIFRSNPEH